MVKCVVDSQSTQLLSIVRTIKDTIKGSINCECCGENKYKIVMAILYTDKGSEKKLVDEINFTFHGCKFVFNAHDRFQLMCDNFIRSFVETTLKDTEKEYTRRDISAFIILTLKDYCMTNGIRHPDSSLTM